MRKKTYHETSRARDKISVRKSMRDRMKLKQTPFIPKTVQYSLDMKGKAEVA